jgi:cytochrome P450
MPDSRISVPAHVPPHLVIPFDFRNETAMATDPWGRLLSLNDKPDIFWSPDLGGYWVLTRAPLIEEAFRNHELFSVSSLSVPKMPDPPVLIPNSLDPPEHTKYRKILAQQMFSRRAMGSIETDTRALARSLVDAFQRRGRCDFAQDFARLLPVDTFLKMMGVPAQRRSDLLPWVEAVFHGRDADEIAAGHAAANRFVDQWLDEQLANPAENQGHMFRVLSEAQVDGRPLTRAEKHSITALLFFGGLDTVSAQMTHVMRHMAEHPESRELLARDPARVEDMVEELLRRYGISFIGREAAADFVFHGVQFKKGDAVICGTPISGLDARTFSEPLSVDPERSNKARHGGFGAGPHRCVGAHLARIQIRIMLQETLPRLRGLRIQPGADLEMYIGATLMLKSLPLEWDVEANH